MQGFHHRGKVDPPEWANNLKNYYWFIRIEGRDKAKRRKYYRLVGKEKLRLAEAGHDQETILAVCRYLSNLNVSNGEKVSKLLSEPNIQLLLDFS